MVATKKITLDIYRITEYDKNPLIRKKQAIFNFLINP